MDDSILNDELRLVVRRVLLDMLKPTPAGEPRPVSATGPWANRSREDGDERAAPWFESQEREIRVTLRGNERSISLLEQALSEGDTSLEVALDSHSGPRARVRAHRTI